MDRRVLGGNRSRYSKTELDVDSNASCGSEEASGSTGAAVGAATFASGLPLFFGAGDGLPAPFRLLAPAMMTMESGG